MLAPPIITRIAPTSGLSTGSTTLTLTGTNLVGGSTVTVGGVACAVIIASGTQLTCMLPANSAIASVPVAVVNGGGVATVSPGFTWVGLPVAWFDAVNGPMTYSMTTVTRWSDRSTAGNDVLACMGQAPEYLPQGLNLRPTVHFPNDGTTCACLTNSNASSLPTGSNARTLISVASLDDTTHTGDIFSFGNPPADGVRMALFTSGGDFGVDTGQVTMLTTTQPLFANQGYLFTFRYAAGTVLSDASNELRLNQSMVMTNGAGVVPNTSGTSLGIGGPPIPSPCNQSHAGSISEILIYDRMLSPAETGVIEAYLAGKYAF
jgi:hypothetical protein